MRLLKKSRLDSAGLMLRLMLRHNEVFRLPAISRGVQVVSGRAWLTVAGEDIFLKNGQRLWLVTDRDTALVSAVGQTPLILEVLGDSASASPGMESMLKKLSPQSRSQTEFLQSRSQTEFGNEIADSVC